MTNLKVVPTLLAVVLLSAACGETTATIQEKSEDRSATTPELIGSGPNYVAAVEPFLSEGAAHFRTITYLAPSSSEPRAVYGVVEGDFVGHDWAATETQPVEHLIPGHEPITAGSQREVGGVRYFDDGDFALNPPQSRTLGEGEDLPIASWAWSRELMIWIANGEVESCHDSPFADGAVDCALVQGPIQESERPGAAGQFTFDETGALKRFSIEFTDGVSAQVEIEPATVLSIAAPDISAGA